MLKKQYLKKKPTCKVTFSLPIEAAPDAKEIRLLGDFNGWSWQEGTPMKRGKEEYTAVLELPTGRRYEYRYLIDNEKWENDWKADDYTPTHLGVYNSIVMVDEPLDTGNPTEEIQEKAKSEAIQETKAPKTVKAKRPTSDKPTRRIVASTKDDLTKIEGIGPKIQQILNDRGIMTFTDLANTNTNVLKTMLADAGSRNKIHDPGTWAEQAQLAAAGSWDVLASLQAELKKGKR